MSLFSWLIIPVYDLLTALEVVRSFLNDLSQRKQ